MIRPPDDGRPAEAASDAAVWLKFVGCTSPDDLRKMAEAIDRDCENIEDDSPDHLFP